MRAGRVVAGVLCVCAALAGCEREMRDMYQQPRLDPGEPSAIFADGRAERTAPPGTVVHARGDLAAASSGRRGVAGPATDAAAERATAPPPPTLELLRRGQDRFSIYCLPCHSPVGDGDGPVVRRGFPRPPSYHEPRLREASDRHFFDVITSGYGVMAPYADRVTPADRWAIVAYIRALQLSRNAPAEQLPAALQAALKAAPAASQTAEGRR